MAIVQDWIPAGPFIWTQTRESHMDLWVAGTAGYLSTVPALTHTVTEPILLKYEKETTK